MNFAPIDLQGRTAKDDFPYSKEKLFQDYLKGKIEAHHLMYIRNFPNLYE